MSSVPKPKRTRVYTPAQLEAQKLRMRARREAARKANPNFDADRAAEERERYYKQVPAAKDHMRSSKHRLVDSTGAEVEDTIDLSCNVCNTTYKNKRTYTKHLKSERHKTNLACATKAVEKPVYRCNICDMTFANNRNYQKHLKTKSHLKKLAISQGRDKPKAKPRCNICDQEFPDKSKLRRHEESRKHKEALAALESEE